MSSLTDQLRWQEQAACATAAPDAWFPRSGGMIPLSVLLICASCPVRQACACYAVDGGEEYGVWAGLNPRDLLNLREQVQAGGRLEQLVADRLAAPALEEPTRRLHYRVTDKTARPDPSELPAVA